MYTAGRATYIETVVVAEEELELSGEVAERAGHEAEQHSGGCMHTQRSANVLASLGKSEQDVREPTKPDAGVIATRPAMAPEQKPTADHLRSRR